MGLNPKSAIDDYWHSKKIIKSVVPEYICRHTFRVTWRFLHLNDNNIIEKKIEKVSNILNFFIKN